MQSDKLDLITDALAKAQAEIKCPAKNRAVRVRAKSGASYDFAYTTLDALIEAVRGPLTKHGLWFTQLLCSEYEAEYRPILKTRLMHASGQWLGADVAVMVEEPGIQKFGSALTYYRRYALQCLLGIAAEEDDDANSAAGNEIKASNDNPRQFVAPAHPETGKRYEPYPIPGSDAVEWGGTFIAAIQAAASTAEIAEWSKHNAGMLGSLTKTAPKVRERIAERVAEKLADLAKANKPEAKPVNGFIADMDARWAKCDSRADLDTIYTNNRAGIAKLAEADKTALVNLYERHSLRVAEMTRAT